MEGSTLGEFHTRLAMLLSFHCHLLLVPNQTDQGLPSLYKAYHCHMAVLVERVTRIITHVLSCHSATPLPSCGTLIKAK